MMIDLKPRILKNWLLKWVDIVVEWKGEPGLYRNVSPPIVKKDIYLVEFPVVYKSYHLDENCIFKGPITRDLAIDLYDNYIAFASVARKINIVIPKDKLLFYHKMGSYEFDAILEKYQVDLINHLTNFLLIRFPFSEISVTCRSNFKSWNAFIDTKVGQYHDGVEAGDAVCISLLRRLTMEHAAYHKQCYNKAVGNYQTIVT